MKRKYVKPFLAVESFQLDAAVAGACADAGRTPLNFQIEVCQLANGYFSDNCEDSGLDVYNEKDICYHAYAHEMYITS